MKKIFILAFVCCGFISTYAEEPQNAAQAVQQAQAACQEWGKKAEPASNKEHTGSISYGSNTGNTNTRNSNNAVQGEAEAKIFGIGVSTKGNHSNGNSNEQQNSNSSSGTLYYNCK